MFKIEDYGQPYDGDTERRQESACYEPCDCHCNRCDWFMPEDPCSCIECGVLYCAECMKDEGCIMNSCRLGPHGDSDEIET